MPTSKKRVQKPKEEVQVAVRNPLHTTLGKVIIILLSVAFVGGGLVGLIAILIQLAQR